MGPSDESRTSPPSVSHPAGGDLTVLLRRMAEGDSSAAEVATALVYAELKAIARGKLAGGNHHPSLQPTLLVNEAFLRLMRSKQLTWNDRAHFFATVSRVMRHYVIDHLRQREAGKRPTSKQQLPLDDVLVFDDSRSEEVAIVHQALEELSEFDPRGAKVVEMHYFAGLTFDEIALALQVTRRTVLRDWKIARAWLQDRLTSATRR